MGDYKEAEYCFAEFDQYSASSVSTKPIFGANFHTNLTIWEVT